MRRYGAWQIAAALLHRAQGPPNAWLDCVSPFSPSAPTLVAGECTIWGSFRSVSLGSTPMNSNAICPLCDREEASSTIVPDSTVWLATCPTCGQFEITHQAVMSLRGLLITDR